MGFTSILFGNTGQELRTDMPGFFRDLQLDYLLEQIGEMSKGYRIAPYYYTFPKGKEVIEFRQRISEDLESESLCEALAEFSIRFGGSKRLHQLSLKSEGEVQAATYYVQAAAAYREAVCTLHRQLSGMTFASEGLREFFEYLAAQVEELSASGFDAALNKAQVLFSELEFRMYMDPDKLIVDESEETPKNYFRELAKLLSYDMQEKDHVMLEVFPEPLELSCFEAMIIELLKKSKPHVFDGICTFKETYPEIYPDVLVRFEEEIQFYLGFRKFKKRTERMGYPMCFPKVEEDGEFSGTEVYDLALVWKNADRIYEVVSNRFSMGKNPAFFVVTGPNQGGKTTFARSVGQAVYFSLMGLAANASELCTPMFRGISTHFETEESMESNSGKLKEEINRLLPMLTRIQNKNHFVILNELFTTATTHDAMVMGRKVMENFLERDCHGIYVTHIQELAEETDAIISLVAQLAPGEEGRRTYRILPMAAQGHGYSDVLVKKFNLTYEEIVRRLS